MKEVKSARAGLVCVNNYHMTSKLSTLHVTSEWANISCERSPYCSLNVGIRICAFLLLQITYKFSTFWIYTLNNDVSQASIICLRDNIERKIIHALN